MNDGTAPKGGPGNLHRVHFNNTRRRRYPRCPECGARTPTKELLDRHRVRDCHGLHGGQLNLDAALAEQVEGFDNWSVFS
jgi:hypothetical protein